ncbi:outer membrane lipid asymmetry maintenance protein MlaD [Aestuariicella hydrocarbonica]|uniref:Outer membrane lipid asymmetry maintenance protein MlaD n=1 Tax=Pseudomaricurvus hydrocarbonicus TaxID=1470433 RepID=A0A9E5MLX8_9GAMM|nr:outer membrane lipid asymmetry maintenance protein MlaD [Aestuariicella hydrocarbonica]NHO65753.1 outer membrane lipid asymmetry maintenance protein MlaD [Aestuariicella hydrocarbonica]
MYSRTMEIMVGVFMLMGIIALSFLAIQVSGLSLSTSERDTYTISANFNNVAGLTTRAKVSIAGVTVGQVTAIHLDPLSVRAVVDMAIQKQVDYLTTDSIAAIKTAGVLGDQYVSIQVGGAPDLLANGDTITDTQSALILEDLVGKIITSIGSDK